MTENGAAHYYVDEAGDLTLFTRRGKPLLGAEGVSHCFMVGVAQIPDPEGLHRRLNDLRLSLLTDPFFREVPSMQPQAGKTARCFHAKDDCQEVREKVFRFLAASDIKVQIGIRRKSYLISDARFAHNSGFPFKADTVYDHLITNNNTIGDESCTGII